ncbi:MAG: hypothetical protein DRR16_31790 [Candidatus Parabeggiatoa sp. nov. 3]|nr:MAG: hypothetical protein DRR00_25935 [Gammaproteobacteria bacterium]RKZ59178.1 MAG: hypothetical protein DRQ99_24155 [Gammaproteobacteria bacterium]RKZ74872.1 MAG: hypothetical protein DRR16_31790 [Gammaproteobacteria bacterium]
MIIHVDAYVTREDESYKKQRRLLRRRDGKPKKTKRDYQQLISKELENGEERILAKFEQDLKEKTQSMETG